mgnify:CR=1 FL=1
MGSVYLANDTRLPRQWALKELIQNTQDESERIQAEQSFVAEAQILSGLKLELFPFGISAHHNQINCHLSVPLYENERSVYLL